MVTGSAPVTGRGGLRAALAWLARDAPARVFAVVGEDPPGDVDDLRLSDVVQLVDTPRSATVLLVVGGLPALLHEPAQRAHDQLAHPRCTVWWVREPAETAGAAPFPDAVVVGASDDVASALLRVQQDLLAGRRTSDAALLPDTGPAPWRGLGPYGQGGSGMTGGVPYGRPMAGRAPDRDGLELDQLPVRIGPFFPPFPPGLVLDVKFQGDIVQDAVVAGNAFAVPATPMRATATGDSDPFLAALDRPVLIADLERARARHHLRWLAHALRIHGLDALARRTLSIAVVLARGIPDGAAGDVAALARFLERTHALGWATAGVGVIAAEHVVGRGLGPITRAAAVAEDARLDDPAYQRLGFEPVVQLAQRDDGHHARHGGDARARWRQRLAEIVQSIRLAARAGDARTGGHGTPIEGPRGRLGHHAAGGAPSAQLLALLPDLLRGQEWGDAVTIIVSLDIDMREAAPDASPLAPPPGPTSSDGMGAMGGKMSGGADEHAHHGHGGGMT